MFYVIRSVVNTLLLSEFIFMYGKIYRKVVENKIISEVKSQFKPRITTGAIRTVLESIVRFWLHGSELHGVWHFLFFGHCVVLDYLPENWDVYFFIFISINQQDFIDVLINIGLKEGWVGKFYCTCVSLFRMMIGKFN